MSEVAGDSATKESDPIVEIGGRRIGRGEPVYVIGEISANHGGSLHKARQLVRVAADAGADAVKLQTYRPDTITIDVSDGPFRIDGGTLWDGRTLFDLYADAMTPWEWHEPLMAEAAEAGIHCFSSPFDDTAVEYLEALDVPAFKIASFEIIDVGLIARAARSGRPLIISTGMADVSEIDEAVRVAKDHGAGGVILLRCNSSYPAPAEEMDLRTMTDMAKRWPIPVGLSDHTLSDTSTIAAVALGASVIEKHITLDRSAGGPDAAFSLEPPELEHLVSSIRTTQAAIGDVRYGPSPAEKKSIAFRRSLYAIADIAVGEVMTIDNVRSIRPAGGLAPRHLPDVLGRFAAVHIARGTPIDWPLLQGQSLD